MVARSTWLACFALGLLCARHAGAADSRPPNFVVIVIDDFGWSDLGCYGSRFYHTPNIDQLASRGIRFTDGYAACPVCSPTRASLLTGRYPARLHLTDWLPGRPDRPSQKLLRPVIFQHLPLEELTVAEALKPAGYVSASIGKWHLGGPGYLPEQQGFALNRGGTQTGSPPGGYFRFKTPTLVAHDDKEYLTDRLTDEAEGFLAQSRDKPLFLYLAHYAVHIPLQAKPKLVAKYQDSAREDEPQHNAIYAAMIQSVDESVGRIVRKLAELEISDRTYVIFTSDNGGLSVKEGPNTPATSNAPLRAGKGYLYEGGIRVPWIITGPAVARPGRTSNVPICSVDLLPTLLELASVAAPKSHEPDGVSVVPLLKETGSLDREALYWHYPHYSNQGGKPGGAVRAGDFKLIEFYEDDHAELYDLKTDLSEAHDLAASQPETVNRLRRQLAAWRASVSAQMPSPNPAYRSAP